MSEGMPSVSGEKKPNPTEIFMSSVNEEISALEASGRLSKEQSDEKRKAAGLVEHGFSQDPAHDGLIFARAGVVNEQELIATMNHREGAVVEGQTVVSSSIERGTSPIEKIDRAADIIENVIQRYAEILREKWMENHALEDANPIKEPRAQSLFAAIASLERAQENFTEAFARLRASKTELDDDTIEQLVSAGKAIGKKFETLV